MSFFSQEESEDQPKDAVVNDNTDVVKKLDEKDELVLNSEGVTLEDLTAEKCLTPEEIFSAYEKYVESSLGGSGSSRINKKYVEKKGKKEYLDDEAKKKFITFMENKKLLAECSSCVINKRYNALVVIADFLRNYRDNRHLKLLEKMIELSLHDDNNCKIEIFNRLVMSVDDILFALKNNVKVSYIISSLDMIGKYLEAVDPIYLETNSASGYDSDDEFDYYNALRTYLKKEKIATLYKIFVNVSNEINEIKDQDYFKYLMLFIADSVSATKKEAVTDGNISLANNFADIKTYVDEVIKFVAENKDVSAFVKIDENNIFVGKNMTKKIIEQAKEFVSSLIAPDNLLKCEISKIINGHEKKLKSVLSRVAKRYISAYAKGLLDVGDYTENMYKIVKILMYPATKHNKIDKVAEEEQKDKRKYEFVKKIWESLQDSGQKKPKPKTLNNDKKCTIM